MEKSKEEKQSVQQELAYPGIGKGKDKNKVKIELKVTKPNVGKEKLTPKPPAPVIPTPTVTSPPEPNAKQKPTPIKETKVKEQKPKPPVKPTKPPKKKFIHKPVQTFVPGVQAEPWMLFDRAEDDMVVEDMKGTIGEFPLCYSFNQDGKPKYGINAKGSIELAKKVKGIMSDPRTPPTVVAESEKFMRVASYVIDVVNKVGIWGVAQQPKFIFFKGGGCKFDDKAFIKASTKSQRNGFLKLIPEKVKVAAISEWVQGGKVMEIKYENFVEGEIPQVDEGEKFEGKEQKPLPQAGGVKL